MLIGLTGGIASGKSTVAKVWERLGGKHIDADILAREVVQPGSIGLNKIVERFGRSILDSSGSLNREGLGKLVFSDPKARLDLENLLHPLIQKLAQEKIKDLAGENIFYTIPLLVETNSPLEFEKIVTVSAPEEIRINRLVTNRGLSEAQAKERIAAQASDREREAVADIVIDSNCSMAELEARAEEVWFALTSEALDS